VGKRTHISLTRKCNNHTQNPNL